MNDPPQFAQIFKAQTAIPGNNLKREREEVYSAYTVLSRIFTTFSSIRSKYSGEERKKKERKKKQFKKYKIKKIIIITFSPPMYSKLR